MVREHFRKHEPIRDVPLRDDCPSGGGVERPAGAEAASFARRGAASERARVVSGVSRSLFIVGIRCELCPQRCCVGAGRGDRQRLGGCAGGKALKAYIRAEERRGPAPPGPRRRGRHRATLFSAFYSSSDSDPSSRAGPSCSMWRRALCQCVVFPARVSAATAFL